MSAPVADRRTEWRTGFVPVQRVLVFTDALVGIIMTLLVTEVVTHLVEIDNDSTTVAEGNRALLNWIEEHLWYLPSHAAALAVITYLWRRHHELFRHFDRISRGTLWWNAGFLLSICLMPFATALVARSDGQPLALAFFFALVALAMVMLWQMLEHGRAEEMGVSSDPEAIRLLRAFIAVPTASALIGLLLAAAAFALGWGAAPIIGILFLALLATTPLVLRLVGRGRRVRQPAGPGEAEDFHHQKVQSRPTTRSTLAAFFGGSDPDRTIVFSDGVYAIAITLMAFQLVPDTTHFDPQDVPGILREAFLISLGDPSSVWFFIVSFFMVMVLWMLHLRIFMFTDVFGGRTTWLNAIHLFWVIWVPVMFGIRLDAAAAATIPWWLVTASYTLAALSLIPLAWSALVFEKHQNPATAANTRYVITRCLLTVLLAMTIFAPFGIFRFGILGLLLMDPLINYLWQPRGASGTSPAWRYYLLRDPADGVGSAIQTRGVLILLSYVLLIIWFAWVRNDLVLLTSLV